MTKRWIKYDKLEPHHCRYIRGDTIKEFRYCADEKLKGSSYCPTHAALCSNGKPDRSYFLHKAEEKQREAA